MWREEPQVQGYSGHQKLGSNDCETFWSIQGEVALLYPEGRKSVNDLERKLAERNESEGLVLFFLFVGVLETDPGPCAC